MKRKMISVVAMMMVAALALGSCGGKKNAELDEDVLELLNEVKEEASAPSSTKAHVTTQEEKAETPETQNQSAIETTKVMETEESEEEKQQQELPPPMVFEEPSFEMMPEMKEYGLTDDVIQIYDMLLLYDETKTVEEIIDVIENSSVLFEYEYDPQEWLAAGAGKEISFVSKERSLNGFSMYCRNKTDGVIDLKDAVVSLISTNASSSGNYKWFRLGFPMDLEGLTYETVPNLFPGKQVKEEAMPLRYGDDHTDDEILFWDASRLEYAYKEHDEDGSFHKITFEIDSSDKSVKRVVFQDSREKQYYGIPK